MRVAEDIDVGEELLCDYGEDFDISLEESNDFICSCALQNRSESGICRRSLLQRRICQCLVCTAERNHTAGMIEDSDSDESWSPGS